MTSDVLDRKKSAHRFSMSLSVGIRSLRKDGRLLERKFKSVDLATKGN